MRILLIIRFLLILLPAVANSNTVIEVFWYKPHYQCGSDGTTTPRNAANFINSQLRGNTDFLAISQWVNHDKILIGEPERYGTIGAVCGYNSVSTLFATPIVLFYERSSWTLENSYPSSSSCASVPSPPLFGNHVCTDKVTPSHDNCCSCTFSKKEYSVGKEENQSLGQRPWVAGIFRSKKHQLSSSAKICVVAADFPHPLANQTLWDLNGHRTSDPRPFSIMRNICTETLNTDDCIPNLNGTSIFFGTDVFVEEISKFCGDLPIILMADTNVGVGDFPASSMFVIDPLHSLEGVGPLVPYTCCNDTSTGGGLNHYASDQILVSGGMLHIDRLEGGSIAPGGPLADNMGYQCHANEEHAPLRAHISYEKKNTSRLRANMMKDASTALFLTKSYWF